jgi:hypothetical protein
MAASSPDRASWRVEGWVENSLISAAISNCGAGMPTVPLSFASGFDAYLSCLLAFGLFCLQISADFF